jgi:hypothetical protein
MNFVRPKKSCKALGQPPSPVVSCMNTLDRSIPNVRTVLIAAGVGSAALNAGILADYLFAAGLLLHFTIWFEDWWCASRVH